MQYTSPTLRPLDFTSLSLFVSPLSLLLSLSFSPSCRSPSLSPPPFLSSYPVERARYPFRADIPWRIPGTKAATIPREYVGETRNVKRVCPLLPPSSASAYPTSLSLFLHLFSSVSICISFSLIVYPSPLSLPLYLSFSLSLIFLLPFSQPAYPLKGGGPRDETDPTRISGAIEANRGRMSNAALSTSLVRVLLVGSIFFSLPRDPKARTRRSAIGERNKCDNSRNSAFIYTASAVLSDPMDLSPFVR